MFSGKVDARDDKVEASEIGKEELCFTPSLARRLSRQFIEQNRRSVPRSPSVPRDSYYRSPTRETLSLSDEIAKRHSTSDQTEYRGRSVDRGIRRTNSLLEPAKLDRQLERHSPRRSVSLFDDNEDNRLLLPPPLPRHVMTLGRKYKEASAAAKSSAAGTNARRENLHGYRTDKIQEESGDDVWPVRREDDTDDNNGAENGSVSESASISMCNSHANLIDTTTTTSSVSARSCETSPTESSSNLGDYGKSFGAKPSVDVASRSFETRLLAAENLIKESKLRNLTPQRFNPNLICNYKDTDKCDKEALITTAAETSANPVASKRRSCIPSLRLRSASLTRESSADRRKSVAGSQDLTGASQERSILSKFFRGGGSNSNNNNNNGSGSSKEIEPKDKNQKPKQHRISRFLRPDFFDTPREESQYVKEKEAQKAAENERRKSRFMKRKSESKERKEEGKEDEICKEQKNALQRDKRQDNDDAGVRAEDKPPRGNEDRERARSSFLHSLEKKLERLRSAGCDDNTSAKATTANGGVPPSANDERKVHDGLREKSAPPVECPPAPESGTVKRALSVEDLPLKGNQTKVASKGAGRRMTSVLGLFRSADAKQNGGRSPSAIMSKLKRSPPKCASSRTEPAASEEDAAAAASKIPTKFARAEGGKTAKKVENKRSPEKIVSEYKRSPPKEKLKEKESIIKEKKLITEKQSREVKRMPEKTTQSDSSISSSADKLKLERTEPSRRSSDESESAQKAANNNKHAESIVSVEDKKLIKTKKNISSLNKNESATKIDKGEEVDKKTKKPVKAKESSDKDEINGAKKKKIVRVVKKVVKKSSDSSESKSDEKEKATSKPLTKKKILTTTTTRKEKSPEGPTQNSIKRNNPDDQAAARSYSHPKQTEPDVPSRETAKPGHVEHSAAQNAPNKSNNAKGSAVDDLSQKTSPAPQSASSAAAASHSYSNPATAVQSIFSSNVSANSSDYAAPGRASTSPNLGQTKPPAEQHRPSRAGLKLDLSKIPQHTFRHTTPKRDSPPKSGSPRANSAVESLKTDVAEAATPDKLMECLSKMTHHANITGNKIIIDKPLRAKDVAELRREVAECARIIENHIESRNDRSVSQTIAEITAVDSGEAEAEGRKPWEITSGLPKERPNETDGAKVTKEGPAEDCTSELFSPEEPESFDSWSICSADLNHNRGDLHSPLLHSPTSPTYSLFMRGDSSESVIDRIRRRSFYSRFNDRKRPSLTAPPPGVSSVTLPRRFSFNSSRERERSRLYNYGVPRTR